MGDDDERSGHDEPHAPIGGYERNESEAVRLDRNYSEQLQELRVAETGVQILFAFLLAISFQERFASIDDYLRTVYVITLVCAALSVAFFIAPVAVHRVVFRRHLKDELVAVTARLAAFGLVFLALSMLGALLLIIDYVVNAAVAWIVVGSMATLFLYLWYVLPRSWHRRTGGR